MIGVYDFCGHYEWTFAWLERHGGRVMLQEYWDQAICQDSQQHAVQLIEKHGFAGMKEYWGHSLAQEAAGYTTTATDTIFRIDIQACPSKGFLIHNHLEQYPDYCDHCMGWIGPMLQRAGFVIDHQHNHRGQCWWEIRHVTNKDSASAPGELTNSDVRLAPDWNPNKTTTIIDTYLRTNHPNNKKSPVDGNVIDS